MIHAGSQYEYTALPGNSDFDLQFCINLAHCYPNPQGMRCDWEGWVFVEGGPSNLLDDKGDLASSKVGALEHLHSHSNSYLWQYFSPRGHSRNQPKGGRNSPQCYSSTWFSDHISEFMLTNSP